MSYNPSTVTNAQIAAIKAEVRSNVRSVSAATTAVAGDEILATAGAGGFAVTLPAPAANTAVTVKKVDSAAGSITVTPNGGLIDGAATAVISTQYMSLDFFSDGTNWYVH